MTWFAGLGGRRRWMGTVLLGLAVCGLVTAGCAGPWADPVEEPATVMTDAEVAALADQLAEAGLSIELTRAEPSEAPRVITLPPEAADWSATLGPLLIRGAGRRPISIPEADTSFPTFIFGAAGFEEGPTPCWATLSWQSPVSIPTAGGDIVTSQAALILDPRVAKTFRVYLRIDDTDWVWFYYPEGIDTFERWCAALD